MRKGVDLKLLIIAVFVSMTTVSLASAHAASDAANDCYKSLAARPELAGLSGKVALSSVQDQTFAMLVNRETATPAERPIIAHWAELLTACYKIGGAFRESLPTNVQQVSEDQKTRLEDIAIQLYDGKITYGEFATKRRSIASESLAKLASLRQAARDEAQAVSAARETEAQRSKAMAQEQVRRDAQVTAVSANQRCQSARANMVEFCKPVEIPGSAASNPFTITPPDMMGAMECQRWRNQVNKVCQ